MENERTESQTKDPLGLLCKEHEETTTMKNVHRIYYHKVSETRSTGKEKWNGKQEPSSGIKGWTVSEKRCYH